MLLLGGLAAAASEQGPSAHILSFTQLLQTVFGDDDDVAELLLIE